MRKLASTSSANEYHHLFTITWEKRSANERTGLSIKNTARSDEFSERSSFEKIIYWINP
jgi:hypothetical protein